MTQAESDAFGGKPLFESPPLIPDMRRPEVAYLHAHNARRGCYSCRVDRA